MFSGSLKSFQVSLEDNEFTFAEIRSVADEEDYTEGSLEVPSGKYPELHPLNSCMSCAECICLSNF